MMNQTGNLDGQRRNKVWGCLLKSLQHICTFTPTHQAFGHSRQPNFPGNCSSAGEHKKLFLLCNDISTDRAANKAKAVLTASSCLSFGHTHRVSYTLANSLLCFNACQRRLKRTEVHNSEENKQADENMGSNPEKKRREAKPKEINIAAYKRMQES